MVGTLANPRPAVRNVEGRPKHTRLSHADGSDQDSDDDGQQRSKKVASRKARKRARKNSSDDASGREASDAESEPALPGS